MKLKVNLKVAPGSGPNYDPFQTAFTVYEMRALLTATGIFSQPSDRSYRFAEITDSDSLVGFAVLEYLTAPQHLWVTGFITAAPEINRPALAALVDHLFETDLFPHSILEVFAGVNYHSEAGSRTVALLKSAGFQTVSNWGQYSKAVGVSNPPFGLQQTNDLVCAVRRLP